MISLISLVGCQFGYWRCWLTDLFDSGVVWCLGWVRCLVAWGVVLFPVLWLLELLVLLICGLFDSGDRLCALGFWFVWFGGVVSLLAALLVVVIV